MIDVILTLSGGCVGLVIALTQAVCVVAGVFVAGVVGSQLLNWLFDWAMGDKNS